MNERDEKEKKRKEFFTDKWIAHQYMLGKISISSTKLEYLRETFPNIIKDNQLKNKELKTTIKTI
jgi:hypothetical protein